ncbi:hypothetical protein [Comamonas sp. JC664]|uniref:hypothetical protein n=1 Tax=Comamonas sp. JC664 TaxID=2801917 RepID=UPI00174CC575|nr:hypothetical protein [Comamonas sp. JC664]MBL0693393.1 hypothetical protein [Comamonas sp. JC664]GHG72271.1 hypothetical protein GCM10012319_18070 [Comamonas sp. KCTC 72670]
MGTTRSVMTALCISLLAAGGASYCYVRADALQVQGQWLMERGTAQAEDYAARLDGSAADAQLKTFAERRGVLEAAHVWQRGMMLGVLAASLAAVCAYLLFLLKRLNDQLIDVTGGDSHVSPTREHASSEHVQALTPSPQR